MNVLHHVRYEELVSVVGERALTIQQARQGKLIFNPGGGEHTEGSSHCKEETGVSDG